jgi:hypothetical protein
LTQEEINKIEDEEAARWQERIEQTIRRAGLEPCDASGCDSGDPLDWTDTQVGHALNEQKDLLERCHEALIWCSGSNDFQTTGMAHVGWEKLVRPLLAELGRALR